MWNSARVDITLYVKDTYVKDMRTTKKISLEGSEKGPYSHVS